MHNRSGKLTIDGLVSTYTEDPNGAILNAQVSADAFSLTAILDIAGASVVSGSFTIDGDVRNPFPTLLYQGTTHPNGLLSGDLLLFGSSGDVAPSTGGLLEFTFGNASGYIADADHMLSDLGAVTFSGGGMILSVGTTTLGAGNFGAQVLTADWTGTGSGDVWVPIPAAVWLFGSGLAVLFGFGSKRKLRSRGVSGVS